MGQATARPLSRSSALLAPLDLPQHGQQFLDIGLLAALVELLPPDDPVPVDDEDGALAVAPLRAPEAVAPGDLPVRVEIGQQREAQPAEVVGERGVRGDVVDVDAQNLGIGRLEALVSLFEDD